MLNQCVASVLSPKPLMAAVSQASPQQCQDPTATRKRPRIWTPERNSSDELRDFSSLSGEVEEYLPPVPKRQRCDSEFACDEPSCTLIMCLEPDHHRKRQSQQTSDALPQPDSTMPDSPQASERQGVVPVLNSAVMNCAAVYRVPLSPSESSFVCQPGQQPSPFHGRQPHSAPVMFGQSPHKAFEFGAQSALPTSQASLPQQGVDVGPASCNSLLPDHEGMPSLPMLDYFAHMPRPIKGNRGSYQMLGCRRHSRLKLRPKRTKMMCVECDAPLCYLCFAPYHAEIAGAQ